MKKKPIVDRKRLDEVLQKIQDFFNKEKLTPFEIRILVDAIYSNLESIDDYYIKSKLDNAFNKQGREIPPGVS